MKKVLLVIILLMVNILADKITLLKPKSQDIVYKIPLKKFKRFICEAELDNGKMVQFVSVKSMLQVYWHQKYFIKEKLISTKIKDIYVQDFLTGDKINAKKAVYVFGSNILGARGDDLIPCKNIQSAKIFEKKYGGTKILKFRELSFRLVQYLDTVE